MTSEFIYFCHKQNDLYDYLSIIIPLIPAMIAICVAIYQYKLNKKQSEIIRCSFLYAEFMKEKQNRIINFRNTYIDFQNNILTFLELIFPNSISPKGIQQGEIPTNTFLDIDNNDANCLYIQNKQSSINNDSLENLYKITIELLNFMEKHKIFIRDNQVLFDDIKTMLLCISRFLSKIINDEDLIRQIKLKIKNLNKNNYIQLEEHTIKYIRSLFYISIHDLNLKRENYMQNLLYMTPNSLFSIKHLMYTDENIIIWINNEKIAFHTFLIYRTWLDTWLSHIDNFFEHSFFDISNSIKIK